MTQSSVEPFELVIFDCDGVLVDSERITNVVFAEMLNELGLNVTLEDMFADFVGNSMAVCLEIIEARLGRAVPRGFVAEFKRRTRAAWLAQLKPVAGIEDVLEELDIPYCVASGGEHEKMRLTLGITGLLEKFEGRLFSVTEVKRGKPHPDVFLHAAKRMGANPARAAVVEDTEIGARAGVAAGMAVFGYAELSDPQKLADAGAVVFRSMKQLPALLRRR
jgi:HAD superfamily hydrolase (TIGR01509 family)